MKVSLISFIADKRYRIRALDYLGLYRWCNDEKYLRKIYYAHFGKELDLNNPKTYNEKLQWLKLYDHNSLYTKLVDKYEVKAIVESIIGSKYIIPTLGVWDSFDQIDFESLPDQFVLKCTHDSGGLVICNDKKTFNKAYARKVLTASLKRNFYLQGREWPYKDVKPRIIAEKYMEDNETKELRDYKFFCFDGIPRALFIASERQSNNETKFDFFDMDFQHLPFTNGHPNADVLPSKPVKFDDMKLLAEKLSHGLPHVRVDFYEVNGCVYFGELTFYHWSGLMPFDPEKWDSIFGSWINLPQKK